MRNRYVEALVKGDPGSARAVIDEALGRCDDVREIYVDVLQPALYEVGRRWSQAGAVGRPGAPRDGHRADRDGAARGASSRGPASGAG